MAVKELKNKRVLILGLAREGRDTLRFLRKRFPKKVFGVADRLSAKQLPKESKRMLVSLFRGGRKVVISHFGKNYLTAVKKYDVVIKSPGIPLRIVAPLLKKGQQLTSETDLFFSECQGTIVGITGTKGKSTTASLIYSILKKGGRNAKLVGNIGKPALEFLSKQTPENIFVYELSSFQLEHLKQSPHVAVLLNVYPEHLNHHGSFAKYVWSKANIAKYQTPEDFLIYNEENKNTKNIAGISSAQKLPYKPRKRGEGWAAFLEPAVLVGKLFGVPNGAIKLAIKELKPLPHRLEYIGTYKGICFVNDSLATIPEATIAALDMIGKQATTLIAGGYDRGVNMKKLARKIEKSMIQTLILFPDTGGKILRALSKKPKNVFFTTNMNEAVRLAFEYTPKNKTCLLSPAASSFNVFKDYADRGEQFKKFVKRYARCYNKSIGITTNSNYSRFDT